MKARLLAGAVVLIALVFAVPPSRAESQAEIDAFVKKAEATVDTFAADPHVLQQFRALAPKAKGVLIIPTNVKGGFILGGSGGHGVMLARDPATGSWSYPAFYVLGSVTLGLQIGGEVSEIVMLLMSQSGVDALLSGSLKLGADVSVAAGPVGAGGKAQTADVLAWARSKGAYAGLNLEGAVVETKDSWNTTYYDKPGIRPLEILVNRTVKNPGADALRNAVGKFAGTN
ncbi:MAG: lipid-binding SYLF domain-containing protein [Rhodospirillales bacterium]|nr:lipid-binding SYLF domain-containing protein [Rhodospirillales bacterium]